MSLQLYRPDGKGGLQPATDQPTDWRTQLRSPRWGRRLDGGRLPALKNSEMNPASRFVSVAFWAVLAAATFVLLLAGYGTGFWH